jgi:DnaK suppressor protein
MPLSPDQLKHFRERLQQRRDTLIASVRAGTENVGDKNLANVTSEVRDAGDESLAMQVSEANIRGLEDQVAEVKAINAALQRIEEGVFGQCLDCGSEIPIERLEVNPTAQRCTYCQARLENLQTGRDPTPSL